MINVLQVVGGLNRGGAETMLMNIFRVIDKSKYKFYFLVYYPEDIEQDYEREVLELGGVIIHFKQKNIISDFIEMKKILENNQFDAIHTHTLFNSYLSIFVAKLVGIPIRITHSHSTGQMKKENILMKIYMFFAKKIISKFSTQFVACGVDAGRYLFGEKCAKDVTIIKNAVNINIFTPKHVNDAKYDSIININKIKVGCIGSFYKVKNHIFLINMAAWLKKKKIEDVMFYLIGQGDLEQTLKEEITKQGLDDYFSFLGVRDDVNNLMNIFDTLVMPSLYEGVPVTLIEAQASGLPCIISNRISKEVDLGLDLIMFLNIEDNYQEWYDCIRNAIDKHMYEESCSLIHDRLSQKGYQLYDSIKILGELYERKN